jgi:hypothetical protein
MYEASAANANSTVIMCLPILHQLRRDRKAIAPFAERLIAKAAFVRQATAAKLHTTATAATASDGISDSTHDPLLHRSIANNRNNSRNNSSSALLHLSSCGSIDAAVTAVPQMTVATARSKVKSAVARTKLASVAVAASKAAAVAAAAATASSATTTAAVGTVATGTTAATATTAAVISSVNHVQTVEFREGSIRAEAGISTATAGTIKRMHFCGCSLCIALRICA